MNLDCANCVINKYCSTRMCPSVNYDTTGKLCTSNTINCYWQILLYQIGQALCEIAALENNKIFQNYLVEYHKSPILI